MTGRALTDVVSADAIRAAGTDVEWHQHGARPEAVIRPTSVDEVAALLRWADAERVGVLPIGTGDRVAPVTSGRYVALSTDGITGIEIYEPADLTFTAGAGTAVSAIVDALEPHDQWMPFDPPGVSGRSLGGLVALGESGPLWAGYGALRNHVLGMTIVTGDGRVLRLGGRVVKNVAGFDLLKPMVGSRGRLGVITSVCLRVSPVPEMDRILLVRGDELLGLVPVARRVGTAPVLPVSSVLVDDVGDDGGPALVVRLHGAPPTVESDRAVLERHIDRAMDTVDAVPGFLGRVRDRGIDAAIGVEATVLPTALLDALAAIVRLDPSGLVVDTAASRISAGLDAVDVGMINDVRASIERLGGALRVTRDTTDGSLSGNGSEPRPEEVDLTARLGQVFDPGGVLWPGRGPG